MGEALVQQPVCPANAFDVPRGRVLTLPNRQAVDTSARQSAAVPLDAVDRARIETIRAMLPSTLLHSCAELEQACRLIAVDRTASLERYAEALIATLSTFARSRLVFFAQGSSEYSDAEIWLARVMKAFELADTAEGRALIHWRIKPIGHRRMRFLVGGMSDIFLAREAADTKCNEFSTS